MAVSGSATVTESSQGIYTYALTCTAATGAETETVEKQAEVTLTASAISGGGKGGGGAAVLLTSTRLPRSACGRSAVCAAVFGLPYSPAVGSNLLLQLRAWLTAGWAKRGKHLQLFPRKIGPFQLQVELAQILGSV